MNKIVKCLPIAAFLLAPLTAAYGWGSEGHSIVAEIAQRRLSPEATAMVARLLGPNVSLASVSSWADDVRGARKETYNWHFVDIPGDKTDYDEARDCPANAAKGDCVVKELARLKKELRCSPSEEAKRDALRFAVHFVGDIHQPLHATGDGLGGNQFKVHGTIHGLTCKGACELGADAANLHTVWDTTLIRRTVWAWGAYVDRLENGWLKTEGFQLRVQGETPVDWAIQSHAAARLVWNAQIIPADGTLDDAYYTKVLPILDQQLALGGVRLARFLNDAYGNTQCEAASEVATGFDGAETGLARFANLGEAKQQLLAYHDRAAPDQPSRYERDQAAVGEAARAYLLQRAGAVTKPAMVLDIDETSLDNWLQLRANDFGYIPNGPCDLQPGFACGAVAWGATGKAPAIAATLKLFKAARDKGVSVFFITGRHEAERAATVQNLQAAGFQGWTGLVMRPDTGPRTPSAADFKAPERARLVIQGYTVIVNMGDQPSDLAGGYAEKAFLLPNPYYRIP